MQKLVFRELNTELFLPCEFDIVIRIKLVLFSFPQCLQLSIYYAESLESPLEVATVQVLSLKSGISLLLKYIFLNLAKILRDNNKLLLNLFSESSLHFFQTSLVLFKFSMSFYFHLSLSCYC